MSHNAMQTYHRKMNDSLLLSTAPCEACHLSYQFCFHIGLNAPSIWFQAAFAIRLSTTVEKDARTSGLGLRPFVGALEACILLMLNILNKPLVAYFESLWIDVLVQLLEHLAFANEP